MLRNVLNDPLRRPRVLHIGVAVSPVAAVVDHDVPKSTRLLSVFLSHPLPHSVPKSQINRSEKPFVRRVCPRSFRALQWCCNSDYCLMLGSYEQFAPRPRAKCVFITSFHRAYFLYTGNKELSGKSRTDPCYGQPQATEHRGLSRL